MIDIPQLTQDQHDEIEELRGMVGWQGDLPSDTAVPLHPGGQLPDLR